MLGWWWKTFNHTIFRDWSVAVRLCCYSAILRPNWTISLFLISIYICSPCLLHAGPVMKNLKSYHLSGLICRCATMLSFCNSEAELKLNGFLDFYYFLFVFIWALLWSGRNCLTCDDNLYEKQPSFGTDWLVGHAVTSTVLRSWYILWFLQLKCPVLVGVLDTLFFYFCSSVLSWNCISGISGFKSSFIRFPTVIPLVLIFLYANCTIYQGVFTILYSNCTVALVLCNFES